MSCCENPQICDIMGKCNDLISCNMPDGTIKEYGEVPECFEKVITRYDYISFSFCMNCGKIQGDFPIESK